MNYDIDPLGVHPIVRQIIDRDCHVSISNRAVIRHVISKLRDGIETYWAMPRDNRRELLRQCIVRHRRNREQYAAVMGGWSSLGLTPPQFRKHHSPAIPQTGGNVMTQHEMLSTTHPEWARMWESLFEMAGSYTDRNPDSGESWQYMGTFWKRRPAIGALLPVCVLVHQFRHRDRGTDSRVIPGVRNPFGRVVIDVATSLKHSGNWNHGVPEGSLA